MIEYVILGTSHSVQDSTEIGNFLAKAIRKHAVQMVAEEYPFPGIHSTAHRTATNLGKRYLQIDLLPDECCACGIYEEMQIRANADCLREKDVRLSHADSLRERFWLERIEGNIDHGRVLVVCGYLHQHFLADRIRERGGIVLEQLAHPTDLLNLQPEYSFTSIELQKYLRANGEHLRVIHCGKAP